jgi:hypothetical protein
LYDLIENPENRRGDWDDLEWLQELNLDVSTDEFLGAERDFTYAELYATLENGNTVVWLTPHTAVARSSGRMMYYLRQLDESCHIWFRVDGQHIEACG